jgi:hypothetical protein
VHHGLHTNISNVVAKWLALLLHNQEVPGPTLAQRSDTPNEVFHVFLSPFRQCHNSALNQKTKVSIHMLSNSIFINLSIICEPGSSVSIVTGYGLGNQWRQRIFHLPSMSSWLWGPPSLPQWVPRTFYGGKCG